MRKISYLLLLLLLACPARAQQTPESAELSQLFQLDEFETLITVFDTGFDTGSAVLKPEHEQSVRDARICSLAGQELWVLASSDMQRWNPTSCQSKFASDGSETAEDICDTNLALQRSYQTKNRIIEQCGFNGSNIHPGYFDVDADSLEAVGLPNRTVVIVKDRLREVVAATRDRSLSNERALYDLMDQVNTNTQNIADNREDIDALRDSLEHAVERLENQIHTHGHDRRDVGVQLTSGYSYSDYTHFPFIGLGLELSDEWMFEFRYGQNVFMASDMETPLGTTKVRDQGYVASATYLPLEWLGLTLGGEYTEKVFVEEDFDEQGLAGTARYGPVTGLTFNFQLTNWLSLKTRGLWTPGYSINTVNEGWGFSHARGSATIAVTL